MPTAAPSPFSVSSCHRWLTDLVSKNLTHTSAGCTTVTEDGRVQRALFSHPSERQQTALKDDYRHVVRLRD